MSHRFIILPCCKGLLWNERASALKKDGVCIFSLLCLCLPWPVCGIPSDRIHYQFPSPGAQWVTPNATLILKFNRPVAPDHIRFSAIGRKSGIHTGDKIHSDDYRTLIYRPETPFAPRETVQITVRDTQQATQLLHFAFSTSSGQPGPMETSEMGEQDVQSVQMQNRIIKDLGSITPINGISVPSDFPEIHVLKEEETAPGRIFFNTWFTTVGRYLIICENDGTPYFYRRFNTALADFKVHPSGVLSAFIMNPRSFMILNRHYDQTGTFAAGHGYLTDPHDLVLLPNGHALIIGFEWIDVDMSELVDGGDPRARVQGSHIQEVDHNGNVFFEFRCWDHYRIQDTPYKNLTSRTIDYTHTNSVAVDADGHYVISVRHFNEITKINRHTGHVIWRLGGPYNQFEFVNDPYELDYPHHARPVPGKPDHYTIFDNGNHRSPEFSRAVEFKVDTACWTAEKVWEFRHTPDLYASGMGSVQRLPNGNTFIDWGRGPPASIACEVDSNGRVLYETERIGIASYRSKRFEWEGMLQAPYLIAEPHNDRVVLIFNQFGNESVDHYHVYGDTLPEPTHLLMTSRTTSAVLTELTNNRTWFFRVASVDTNGHQSAFSNTEEVPVRFLAPDANQIINGDFSRGSAHWLNQNSNEAEGRGSVVSGQYHMQIENGGSDYSHIQVYQDNLEILEGETYGFKFDAWSDSAKVIDAKLIKKTDPSLNYGHIPLSFINQQAKHFSYEFTMESPNDFKTRVVFNCGGSDGDVYLDNISLMRTDPAGVESREREITETVTLHPNYPNPFNTSTRIRFVLCSPGPVTLKVYDLLGRQTDILIDETREAGSHSILFNGSDRGSGVYLIRLETSSEFRTRKIILMK